MRKLSKIDESSWGEMRKRSSGETIRKENDVNLFDTYGLYDYIKQHYSIKTQTTITRLVGNGGSIYISLYEDTDGYDTILMYDNIDGDRRLYISGGFKETGEYIYNEMCSEYTLTEMNDEDPDGHPLGNIRVEPKGCRYENLTNSFFLEVLDFIIERIEKPLEKQIEKKSINESAWGDMRRRSSGEAIRKENAFNPDYVDFGPETTVYWAVYNLEIDGEVKFYFDDVKDYNNNGWRLPTVDEVNQLKWNIRTPWYGGCKHLEFDDGNELRLKTNGSGGFHMWTKEINTKFPSSAYAYGFDNSNVFDVTNFNKSINRLYVFLVKDKKVNESTWGEMRKRSSGNTIRKEDDINHLDFYEFVEYLKNAYEIDDTTGFFEIGLFPTMGTDVINVSIPIEKKDIYVEQRYGNRMMSIGYDKSTEELVNIRPNKYVFELYPRELNKVFGDKFEIDHTNFELKPKDGVITNSLCIEVIDKLLDMVERPILIKK